jgi:glycosyltransferase involved in cell wall biosynthesis
MHDVLPFSSDYVNIKKLHEVRQLFINEAEVILIHNKNSFDDLIDNFFIDSSKVLMHNFPIMDAKLFNQNIDILSVSELKEPYIFLFIGHGRPEKGLDILVDAWVRFFSNDTRAGLVVAGNILSVSGICSKLACFNNVLVKSNFVSDEEYFTLIKNSNCLVLPYKTGTNSGIPSTAFSLDTDIICSDIPMFVNNTLIPNESFFHARSVESLATKMLEKLANGCGLSTGYQQTLTNYRVNFCRDINATYNKIVEI